MNKSALKIDMARAIVSGILDRPDTFSPEMRINARDVIALGFSDDWNWEASYAWRYVSDGLPYYTENE